MQTRLTELLGIEHPVMLAGMGGVSYSALVAAVSGAGGFGCLGASTMRLERMVDEMSAVRAATDRPFGVDLLTAMPGGMVEQVEKVIEGGATVFVAGLGVPADVVDLCHANGLLVVNMCGKVDHARRALDAGCDMVVAQGTEAGGHTGQVATLPLVPQIVDAVGDAIPVVAAGGIVDGRGLAAALALGADGVWMGTRFIATPEARGVVGYKDALLATREDGTVISRAFSGKTMRGHPQRVHPVLRGQPVRATALPGAAGALDAGRCVAPRWGPRDTRGRPRPRGIPDRSGRGRHHVARARRRARQAHRGRGRVGPGPHRAARRPLTTTRPGRRQSDRSTDRSPERRPSMIAR